MNICKPQSDDNIFSFLQKLSELLGRVLRNIQYLPPIGDLLILGRTGVVMGIFANKRSICNDFGSQEGAFFNPSVEIGL